MYDKHIKPADHYYLRNAISVTSIEDHIKTRNIIFSVLYGSSAHGMTTDESDKDWWYVFDNEEEDNCGNIIKTKKEEYRGHELCLFINNATSGNIFTIETLYAPESFYIKPMPEELKNLVVDGSFLTNQISSMSRYYAHWYNKNPHYIPKFAYHSARILIESIYMMKNNCGPRVVVTDFKDELMAIKNGLLPNDEVKKIISDLIKESESTPDPFPDRADCKSILKWVDKIHSLKSSATDGKL